MSPGGVSASPRLPDSLCRVSGSSRVWEGAAPWGASVTMGIAVGADCDAARGGAHRRGVPSDAALRSGGRVLSGVGARAPERGMGGSWASRSGRSLPAALFPVIGRSANDSRGGERGSPAKARRATFTFVSHKSHWGNLEAAGGQNCISCVCVCLWGGGCVV